MSEKPVYKEKTCYECGGKCYKINYYYSHRKSKKHLKNVASIKLKEELLNGTDEKVVTDTTISPASKLITAIKELINNYETETLL